MWFWHPLKEEIENQVEAKEKEFAKEENRNPRLSAEDWLQRYLFTDSHEIFFATFPFELHAWVLRLAESDTSTHSDRPVEWNSEVIHRLKWSDNFVSCAIDFWLNSLLEGFVIEFAVDMLKAYNEAKR